MESTPRAPAMIALDQHARDIFTLAPDLNLAHWSLSGYELGKELSQSWSLRSDGDQAIARFVIIAWAYNFLQYASGTCRDGLRLAPLRPWKPAGNINTAKYMNVLCTYMFASEPVSPECQFDSNAGHTHVPRFLALILKFM